jgi:hypothetical protein
MPSVLAGFVEVIVLTINQAVTDGDKQRPLGKRFAQGLNSVKPESPSFGSDLHLPAITGLGIPF